MIELITGKPGSGKTYLAVQRLLELPVGKYVIWHNIAGLKPEVFPEPHMIKEIPADLKAWGTKENQIEYADACKEKYGRPMLVVIDEAQMVFGEKNADLKAWLSWHRHLGQDIWLIAQHAKMLHQDYVVLAEYEVRAVKSMILNMLVYQFRVGGETFKTARRRKDTRVFQAYRSFDHGEVSKRGFNLLYWSIALGVLALGGFAWVQYGFFSKAEVAVSSVGKGLRGDVLRRDEVVSKGRAVEAVDIWEELSYAGVVGNKVLIQRVKGGKLLDLGDVIGMKYGLVRAGTRSALVVTEQGQRELRRKPLIVESEPISSGEAAPELRRKVK